MPPRRRSPPDRRDGASRDHRDGAPRDRRDGTARDPRDDAARDVEAEIEELGDPEGGPPLPSAALAAQTAARVYPPRRPGLRLGRGTGTSREILRLAWPVMASQVLVSIVGLVDPLMVGRLEGPGGAAVPLAAVGYATQFFVLLQSSLFAIGFACVALMARAIGAHDPARSRQVLAASLQVALVLSAAFSGLLWVGAEPVLSLLGAEPLVLAATLPYLRFILGASVPLAVAMTLDAALRANRDTRTPMRITLVVTAVKLGGNGLLIFGTLGFPRLELVGAGIATVLSQAVAVTLFVAVLLREPAGSPLALRRADWALAAGLRREVVRIAVPGVVERLVMNFSLLAYFWVLSTYYGTVAVAAYTVGVRLLAFSWIPGTGYAQACATLVGQSLGADDPDGATRTGWRAATWALATAVVLGLVCALLREPLALLFTRDLAVVTAMGPFLLALAIAQPFLQLHFSLAGAHRGAGDNMTPLVAATVSNWLFRVPLAWSCAAVFGLPLVWVWFTIIADHCVRAVWLVASFRRGRWRTRLAAPGLPARS